MKNKEIDQHPSCGKTKDALKIDLFEAIKEKYANLTPLPEDIYEFRTIEELLLWQQGHQICRAAQSHMDGTNLNVSLKPSSHAEFMTNFQTNIMPIDLRKALNLFEEAEKKDSTDAFYNIGLFYSKGFAGLPKDFKRAREYWIKAAQHKAFVKHEGIVLPNIGVAESEHCLGLSYRDGCGIEKNDKKAFEWFLKSAQHGDSSAQNNLGNFLLYGRGCNKNENMARQWFKKSANFFLPEGLYNYAAMLIEGTGGSMDIPEALELLKAASQRGLSQATEKLQYLYRSGLLGGSAMDDLKNVLKDCPKNPAVAFQLGRNHMTGSGGLEKDLFKAAEYFKKAASIDHGEADLLLGYLYNEKNENENAFQHFLKSAEQRNSMEAKWELGMMYAYGHGCKRDAGESRRWFLRAERQGYKPEFLNLTPRNIIQSSICNGLMITKFEEQENLSTSLMSISDRWTRFFKAKIPSKNKTILDKCLKMFNLFGSQGHSPVALPIINTEEAFQAVKERASLGSTMAGRILKARELTNQALHSCQPKEAFKLLIQAYKIFDLVLVDKEILQGYLKSAKIVLDDNPEECDALFIILMGNMFTNYDPNESVSQARRCIELNPDRFLI
jgi:TPR repeat protein